MEFDIRNILFNEVAEISKKNSEFRNNQFKKNIYREIVSLINGKSYTEINDNLTMLLMLLDVVVSHEESFMLVNRLDNYSSNLYNLEKYELQDTKEYKDTLRKYNTIINNILDSYDSIVNRNNYLRQELEVLKPLLIKYRRTLSNLKYGGIVDFEHQRAINELMIRYGVSDKDYINANEFIRIHNKKVLDPASKISYTVVNMLKEDLNEEEVTNEEVMNYSKRFDGVILTYYRMILKSEDELYTEIIEDLQNQYDDDEYRYVLKGILNYLINDLNSSINDMNNKENYDDIELRKVVIAEYNEKYYKYLNIKRLYNKVLSIEEDEEIVDEDKINIYYALSNNGDSYLEKDLKDIRPEKLDELKQLLDDKRSGETTLVEDKSFVSNSRFKGYRELRGDQIRIMYHNLTGNNVLIMGAFIKKDDNDAPAYNNILSRVNDDGVKWYTENMEKLKDNNDAINGRIYDYIEENKRKGSR